MYSTLALFTAICIGQPACSDAPLEARPPWQRLLTGADDERAAELRRAFNELAAASKFAEAIKPAEEAAALRERVQGKDHWQARDARLVASAFAARAKLKDEQASHLREADDLGGKVNTLMRMGRSAEATPLLTRLLALRQELFGEDNVETARSYENLGLNLTSVGKYAEGTQALQQALAIRQRVLGEEHPATAASHGNLGFNLNAQGKLKEANEQYQEAIRLIERIHGEVHDDLAAMSYNLGSNLDAQQKYAEAGEAYQRALMVWKRIHGEEHVATAKGYYGYASNLRKQGKDSEAADSLRKCIAIRRKLLGDGNVETAHAYAVLGQCLNAQGKFGEADVSFLCALNAYRKAVGEDHPFMATAYNNYAFNLSSQGKNAEATEGFRRALSIRRTALGETHPETAVSYNNLSSNLESLDKFEEAAEGYARALKVWNTVYGERHSLTAVGYNNVAVNLGFQGHRSEAMEMHRKALDIRRKLFGDEHFVTAESYGNIAGLLASEGQFAEAESLRAKVLEIHRNRFGEAHVYTAQAYNSLADILSAQGKHVEAESAAAKDMAIREQIRRLWSTEGIARSITGSQMGADTHYAALLARNGKPREAYTALESSLARGLLDHLARAQLAIPVEQRRQRQQLVDRIQALEQLLSTPGRGESTPTSAGEQPTAQVLQGKAALAEYDQQLEGAFGLALGAVLPLNEIQATLSPDAAMIAWIDLAEIWPNQGDKSGEHWGFLLRAAGPPVAVNLPGSGPEGQWSTEDHQTPKIFQTAIRDSKRPLPADLIKKMTDNRFEPFQRHLAASDQLPAVRHLIVLPPNYAIDLLAPSATQVSYAPSGSVWAYLKNLPLTQSQSVLMLGDPDFGESPTRKFDSLPGSAIEIHRLHERFDSAKFPSRIDMGLEASEPRLAKLAASGELKKYRYLHFATHAVIDNERPSRSALILSQTGLPEPAEQVEKGLPAYDGQVTVQEILEQWELDADLVVLSACETALGPHAGGEGFVGFAQALLTAGARSVVLSLWKVDDTATALLMDRFYSNLLGQTDGLEKPMPKAEALSEAKRWLRELSAAEATKLVANMTAGVDRGKGRVARIDPNAAPPTPAAPEGDKPYAHPYYWAAFILIGDPG